ncbi:MAG: GtrA family protein [Ruminococcus sp.]|nr:GtrA family protein [Ruminococcus sp.]MBQ9078378.1 GtrA family protein [Ruminococcus sp.]MBR6622294.1 GtrA family protein [Ruminococcus sp.]
MKNPNLQEVMDILRTRKFAKLFVGDTENTFIQFFRYLFVGGLATVVDWGVSYLLFRFVFNENYAIAANSISFVAGLAVNYLISTFWIFKNSAVESKLKEFLGFAAIGLVGLFMTMGITWLFELWLADKTSAFQILAKIVSTAAAFFWNFFARKILLFTKKEN